ncbi:MAG: acetyl-CoA carboxylase, biotin carboxyl carrier protein [Gemmatales bacterium]|nr:MAG: acetyl-CoA carboxylase, biotin carboxyl carrier protein [Gemmatales bacterium]
MAEKNSRPFDVSTIKALVSLMHRHELTEIDLREGEMRIRLRRGPTGALQVATAAPALPAPVPVPESATVSTPPPKTEEAPKKELLTIKSPTPGTFYASPNPDAEPFVRVGSRVEPNTVVCIIEAMKIFNEITADCSGVIKEVLVENQQPVEFGQVLFTVDPNG